MSPCSRPSLTKGVTAFLAGLSNFTGYETFLYMRAEDAHHNLYPHSLGGPTRMNNTELVEALPVFVPGLTDFTAQLDESFPLVLDEPKCSAMFRYTAEGPYDGGLYEQEYFHVIQFTADGTEIHESWEMLDPTKL